MEGSIKNKFPSGKLTNRERFRRVMHYQNVDRIPNFELAIGTKHFQPGILKAFQRI
ncbi:hypothetical protein [Caldicellulosiruptor sp. DIB 104C]|uniref:hypothetical protein n=1 Tax=Caldicellulosiruptor sp. DIB 104C TaxID=3019889 RepID=UPI0023068FC3|nr:hypothetical protein [Caldicellulosiruptor sp. DIB 104C]